MGRPLHGGVDRNCCKPRDEGSSYVAPFTGAWIETMSRGPRVDLQEGRPLHGGVDRNTVAMTGGTATISRPLHGGVDRNRLDERDLSEAGSRPLHGGVDRN